MKGRFNFKMSTNLFFVTLSFLINAVFSSTFIELFEQSCPPHHIITQGDQVLLSLDKNSGNSLGCQFESKKKYLFGKSRAQLKLIYGDSAGTVTAFYMISQEWNTRDELDLEFLGNLPGKPYILQTNVYVNGIGDREQRIHLWFDPTKDFHTYSFFWNTHLIIFEVDEIPIRVFGNKEGVPYPSSQVMGVDGALYNAEDWATNGGTVKTNWSNSPFVATFRSFEINACEVSSEMEIAKCANDEGHFWWNNPALNQLSRKQKEQLQWVRSKYLVYDYCSDTSRYPKMPRECLD